ncbi:hypothetical protein [Bosea sp. TAF32]|uniref:hypothetical protein n=1 Tax=Bosea sp. TAF32 TaxID=3237482 RepID=UPI003F9361CF
MALITHQEPLQYRFRGTLLETRACYGGKFATDFHSGPKIDQWSGITVQEYETEHEAISGHHRWIREMAFDFEQFDHFKSEYAVMIPAKVWSGCVQQWCEENLTEQPCIIKGPFTGRHLCFNDKDAGFHFKIRWV